jgi:periplasmic protein TonB
MFDSLPESSSHGQDNTRTSKFLLMTGLIYGVILISGAIASVLYLNPSLADAFDVSTMLAPPPPPAAPPPAAATAVVVKNIPTVTTFTPPTKPPEKIPDPTTVVSKPVVAVSTGVPGGVPGGQPGGVPGGVAGGKGDADPPPPPPPPPPKPTPEATPKPEPPKQIKVSGGVLQGSALNKVQPTYPPIAKAARAAGAVQVQVTISEEGRVIEASVVNGHPLLREAALQAARQWRFKPTELSGVPVKVQGILTFNFTLQ